MREVSWLVAAAITLGACASAPPPPPPPPPLPPALCVLDRRGGADEPDASTWVALLLRGYDPATRRLTSPALDCTGTQVRWEGPALSCDDGALARTALPDRPLEPRDVHAVPVAAGTTLLWIATTHFASGDAVGPVALVTTSPSQLRVVTLGVLRAYPLRVRLRLEDLGSRAVLVADGDLCAPGEAASCARASRVVPVRGDRFAPAPLVGPDGQCLSPAWFETTRTQQRRAALGWERVDLAATLVFGPRELTVEEQVVVHDLGASQGGEALRVLQRAQATRHVSWSGERLVASGGSLWARMTGGGEPRSR